MNDSADQHSQKVAAAHSRLDEVHSRLAACEKHGPAVLELKRNHADLASTKNMLVSDLTGLTDRLDNMEAVVGDASNRHMKELKALKANHDRHTAALTKHGAHLEAFAAHQEQHAPLPERVTYLEQQLGDSADRHATAVAELHRKL